MTDKRNQIFSIYQKTDIDFFIFSITYKTNFTIQILNRMQQCSNCKKALSHDCTAFLPNIYQ